MTRFWRGVWAFAALAVVWASVASAQAAPPPETPRAPRSSGASMTASVGWNYLTTAGGISPDYQSFHLRLAGTVPHLWSDRATLRSIIDEKLGVDERTGIISGTQFRTRHQIRTLALDLSAGHGFVATVGRHRPTSTALGVNDLDGVSLGWAAARGTEFLVFGGTSVEYWEAEFEPHRPTVGAVFRAASPRRLWSTEVSGMREWTGGTVARTRMGASARWNPGVLNLDGRGEMDLGAGILSYARVSVSGKIGPRLAPFAQIGQRRGALFTDAGGATPGFPDTVGYRSALQDASVGATWRLRKEVSIEARIAGETGARETSSGDLWLRHDGLPFGLSGRFLAGASRSVWARSLHGSAGFDRAFGRGRAGLDLAGVAYRWRRPGLSSSTRWRFTPGLRLGWPLPRGANVSLSFRESLDDRLTLRSEVGAWLNARVGP